MEKESSRKASGSTKSTSPKKTQAKAPVKKEKKKSTAQKARSTKSKSAKSVKPAQKKPTTPKSQKAKSVKAPAKSSTVKSKSQKSKATPKTAKTTPKPASKSLRPPASQPDKQIQSQPSQPQASTALPSPKPDLPALDGPVRPAEKGSKFGYYVVIGFGVLILLIVLASSRNMDRFYLTSKDGALIVWQGKFSPQGRKRLVIMPGVRPPAELKDRYTKEEVYPLVFNFYIEKADALMDVPGMLDFVGIKSYLKRALAYATSEQERLTANDRIKQIELTILLYKADAAASKGTLAGLNSAVQFLDQASAMNPGELEAALIQQKMDSIRSMKDSLEPQTTQGVKAPPQVPEQTPEQQSIQDEASTAIE